MDYRRVGGIIELLRGSDQAMNGKWNRMGLSAVVHIWLARISRWLIGIPFCYSGMTKLADIKSFAVIIDGYGLLPEPLVLPTAVLLPIVECLAAVGLLLKSRIALYVVVALLILFIGVLSYGIQLGLDVDCGCFGPKDPEQAYHGLKGALYRDLGFLIPVLYLVWSQKRVGCEETTPSR